jgi:hypothetical protein
LLAVSSILALSACGTPTPQHSYVFKALVGLGETNGTGEYDLSVPTEESSVETAVGHLLDDGLEPVGDRASTTLQCGKLSIEIIEGTAIYHWRGSFPFDRYSYTIRLGISDTCQLTSVFGSVNYVSVP